MTTDKIYVTQNLTIGNDYRIRISEWSSRVDSEVILVNDSRSLEILAKEYCSRTLGQDYRGRFEGVLELVMFLLMFFTPYLIIFALPTVLILILGFFIYKRFRKKKK